MKIVFKKKDNGKISADNFEAFNKKCITEERYNEMCDAVSLYPGITIFNECFRKCMLYAVVYEDNTYKIKKVFAVKIPSGAIKLIFESANECSRYGMRAYIEDGDVLFTEEYEATCYIVYKQTSKYISDNNISEKTKSFGNILKDLGDKSKDTINSILSEIHESDKKREQFKEKQQDVLEKMLDKIRSNIQSNNSDENALKEKLSKLKEEQIRLLIDVAFNVTKMNNIRQQINQIKKQLKQ